VLFSLLSPIVAVNDHSCIFDATTGANIQFGGMQPRDAALDFFLENGA
jgi:hypothetical protein